MSGLRKGYQARMLVIAKVHRWRHAIIQFVELVRRQMDEDPRVYDSGFALHIRRRRRRHRVAISAVASLQHDPQSPEVGRDRSSAAAKLVCPSSVRTTTSTIK